MDENGIQITDEQAASQFSVISQNELYKKEDESWWFKYHMILGVETGSPQTKQEKKDLILDWWNRPMRDVFMHVCEA